MRLEAMTSSLPRSVYLDHNATTTPDPRLRDLYTRWSFELFGNPSSADHPWGWDAREAVEAARLLTAQAVHAGPGRVVFVSGATEALNMAIRGAVGIEPNRRRPLITCTTEHDAVLVPCRYLRDRLGVDLLVLPVDRLGHVDLDLFRATISATEEAVVVVMAANNEIGTLHPIEQMAEIVHAANGVFVCDATHALWKYPLDVHGSAIDFVAVSSHKIHGPKGAGALIAGSDHAVCTLEPLIMGGGQEGGSRGGTLSVAAIVAFGEACRLAEEESSTDIVRISTLRDRLEAGIRTSVDGLWVNGDPTRRLCNTSSIGIKGVDARWLIRDMHDIACSTRSACSSGNAGPSHVLKAIGLSDEDAYSCIRFSLGRFTTEEEIDYTINKVVTSVHKLRRNKSVRM
jgi:cysteine desulfurase